MKRSRFSEEQIIGILKEQTWADRRKHDIRQCLNDKERKRLSSAA